MTATAMPQNFVGQAWSTTLRLFAAIAVLAILIVGSFAVGRTTADDGGAKASVVSTATPSAAASCGHTAHTPPC